MIATNISSLCHFSLYTLLFIYYSEYYIEYIDTWSIEPFRPVVPEDRIMNVI